MLARIPCGGGHGHPPGDNLSSRTRAARHFIFPSEINNHLIQVLWRALHLSVPALKRNKLASQARWRISFCRHVETQCLRHSHTTSLIHHTGYSGRNSAQSFGDDRAEPPSYQAWTLQTTASRYRGRVPLYLVRTHGQNIVPTRRHGDWKGELQSLLLRPAARLTDACLCARGSGYQGEMEHLREHARGAKRAS